MRRGNAVPEKAVGGRSATRKYGVAVAHSDMYTPPVELPWPLLRPGRGIGQFLPSSVLGTLQGYRIPFLQ